MTTSDPGTDPPPIERCLSIGTWNMDHWKRTLKQREGAWSYLQTKSNADVMLLQERIAPAEVPRSRFVHREIAGRRAWALSVVAFHREKDESVPKSRICL